MTELIEGMCRYIGQTVTIFTTSGGLSGSGFSGVLISADCNAVSLLADMGIAPGCPIGSACTGFGGYGGGYGGYGGCGGGGYGFGFGGGSPLGAIVTIPAHAIAAFTHYAI